MNKKAFQNPKPSPSLSSEIDRERALFHALMQPSARILVAFAYDVARRKWIIDHRDVLIKLKGKFWTQLNRWTFPWGASIDLKVINRNTIDQIAGWKFSRVEIDSEIDLFHKDLIMMRVKIE